MDDKKINNMDEVLKHATQVMLKEGHHIPQIVVVGSNNKAMGLMPDFPGDSDQKQELLMSLGAKMRKADFLGNLEEIFLVSEAWMSVVKKGIAPNVAPSQDPARQEVLMIFHQNILENKTEGKSFNIIRDKDEKVTELKPNAMNDLGGTMESPLLEAFIRGYQYPQFAKDIPTERG